MLDFVLEVLSFFGIIYDADERPEARSITVGCAVIFLLAVLAIALAIRFSH